MINPRSQLSAQQRTAFTDPLSADFTSHCRVVLNDSLSSLSRIFRGILLVLACTFSVAGHAKTPAGKYTTLGHGAASCGQWTADQTEGGRLATTNKAWLLGFLTAYNLYGPDARSNVADKTDVQGLVGWVDNYCRANPLRSISYAAEALADELHAR